VVATFPIANLVAAGIEQIDDLVAAAGCDPHALHRVLSHLVSTGFLRKLSPANSR
jgi:hypothetical protein